MILTSQRLSERKPTRLFKISDFRLQIGVIQSAICFLRFTHRPRRMYKPQSKTFRNLKSKSEII